MAEDQIEANSRPAPMDGAAHPDTTDPVAAQAVAELQKLLPEPGIRRRVFSTLLRAATVTEGGGR